MTFRRFKSVQIYILFVFVTNFQARFSKSAYRDKYYFVLLKKLCGFLLQISSLKKEIMLNFY